jgi:hypothetical protein
MIIPRQCMLTTYGTFELLLHTFSGQYISQMSFVALAPPYPRPALAESYYAR